MKSPIASYESIKNRKLSGRYVTHEHIVSELQNLQGASLKLIGRSTLKNPIHAVTFGTGPLKIFGWSQMHGNESTTTKAVIDLFNLLSSGSQEVNDILQKCTISIIPMLNPDGATRYTRENVNGIDLNRDAKELKEVESRILRKTFEDFEPDFCLNLHDQRTIFSAGDTKYPATLSFLAPAMDVGRNVNNTRRSSMQIVASITETLQKYIPNQIGRYDDKYNPNCTGDHFQQYVPTILFEAGHFPEDYMREETRKYVYIALWSAIWNICTKAYEQFDIDSYVSIPENKKNFVDVLLKEANVGGKIADIGIQFEEKIRSGKIFFDPKVLFIDSELKLFGHLEIDCQREKVTLLNGEEVSENDLVDEFLLKGKKLSIKSE